MSGEIDEAQLQKVIDELLRQRCNSGEEHQYHVDQTRNYVKSDIVWERRKEILTLPTSKKKALVVHSCQRDLKAPPMTLLNQDLFYLKHGNSGLKKYILSLHKATVIWERVHDFQLGMESYQQNVNLTAPTITFPRIEKEELFTITCEPVVGMIYENIARRKRE
ncbi:hypothetical protein Tco_0539567 [Tanacetum coccineum]